MANLSLTPANVILLAVQLSIKSDVVTLRTLVAQNRKTLRTSIILRILLTYLPESLDPSKYVQFLLDLSFGQIQNEEAAEFDPSDLVDVSDVEAHRKVRKLRLLPLAWPSAPPDAPDDDLTLFLIHRAYRIDEQTGLISQIPKLLVPFLDHSKYLRMWMISTLLPLLRLNYEYYPRDSTIQTIEAFERLDDKSGVNLLLTKTRKELEVEGDIKKTIGRDLRGLIGPWMYGNIRWKRRRVRRRSELDAKTVAPLDENTTVEDHSSAAWEEVFRWIISQATASWTTCVEAIEQWDGPGDVDLGGYGDGTAFLDEQEMERLEKRYARAILSAAYLAPEASVEAMTGIHRILSRINTLLDFERMPSLQSAAALLSPVSAISEDGVLSSRNATYLRTNLMEEQNPLTSPNVESVSLLYALLISAFLLTRVGVPCTIRRAGELALLQDEREQTYEAQRLIHKIGNGPKGDDKHWTRMRNEILWLRDWGAEEVSEGANGPYGRGIFGKVGKDFLETEILKALLTNTSQCCYPLFVRCHCDYI
jgi:protein transport protein SEC39